MLPGLEQRAPDKIPCQGLVSPEAHPRPGYPLSGCSPAEPDSVSPGTLQATASRRFREGAVPVVPPDRTGED